VVGLFGGIDTQDDRYEGRVWGFAPGEESFLVDRWILYGDPAGEELKRKVAERIRETYTREDGVPLGVMRWCWDSGGHYTDEVYELSKRLGIHYVVPIKGANVYGKPVANFPRKRNTKGVFLTEVGTDNAKEIIYSRLRVQPEPGKPVPGCVHLPANSEICDEEELRQLTAEVKLARISNGRRVYRWESKGKRNEALDCFVYALAALRISQQRFGFNLDQQVERSPDQKTETNKPAPAPENRGGGSDWLNLNNGGSWL
tara:strand:- start:68 stop:841 length:774 start_codon:yes stop_codon:yes gene_type:complete